MFVGEEKKRSIDRLTHCSCCFLTSVPTENLSEKLVVELGDLKLVEEKCCVLFIYFFV